MSADLILTNAVIHTMNPAQPLAEACAVENGRIIAVGGSTEIAGYRRPATRVIDLAGKTVLPGFIDAHQHQVYMGLSFQQVDASSESVSSIEDIVEKVGERARALPSGSWIEGRGYHDARLAEGRNPTRYDLDQATTDQPVFITRMCGHIMALNSPALALAGITAETPDPPGGSIDRDPETGEPTGVIRETAMRLLRRVVPTPDDAGLRDAIHTAAKHNLSKGITSVWEPSIEPDHLRVYRDLQATGEMLTRVTMAHKKILRSGEEVPLPEPFTSEWLSLVAVKLFEDGGFGGATAALSEPYANAPETKGHLVWEQDELNERAREIHEAGLRISIHAIGDVAIETTLNAIEYAMMETAMQDPRHRIEHCGLPLPPLQERIRKLGVVAVLQPPFLWFDGDVYMDRVGPERSRWLYPTKSLLEAGIPVAGSSDGPVVADVNPLRGIYTAVTRKSRAGKIVTAEEAVSIDEALSLYTIRAAYACGEEYLKGSIEKDKLADFIVLADDPTTVDVESIPDIPLEMVFVHGKEVEIQ